VVSLSKVTHDLNPIKVSTVSMIKNLHYILSIVVTYSLVVLMNLNDCSEWLCIGESLSTIKHIQNYNKYSKTPL